MSTCCCSLPYMNANACRNCPNNSSKFIDYSYSPTYKLNDYDDLITEIKELKEIIKNLPVDNIIDKMIYESKLKYVIDKLSKISDFPTFIEKIENITNPEE